jgi:hypothetical protein
LVACTILAFRTQGESWLVTPAAVAVIGEAILQRAEKVV